MIEKKETVIRCDFCRKRVAVKQLFRFRPVYDYYTIGKQHFDCGPQGTKRVHLCSSCYDDVKYTVVDCFGQRKNDE